MRVLILLMLAACWHPTKRGDFDTYHAVGLRPDNAARATPPPDLAAHALAVGARVPAVPGSWRDDAGTPWSIPSGRAVIVFYRGDWDAADRTQLADLQAHAADVTQRKATLAAVSVDSVPTGEHLAGALKLSFPLVSDPGHRLIAAFGVYDDDTELAWPSIFVVDHGAIAWRWIAGDAGKRITTTEVLAALDALAKSTK